MERKTEKAVKLFKSGDITGALGIFRTFKLGFTKEERRLVQIAYESQSNGDFYRSIGVDTEAVYNDAVAVLKLKYGL